jgi:predicted RNA-binding protein with PIN domain
MHAVGYASKTMTSGDLQRGRNRLLDWIADLRGERPDGVRVVFDGAAGKKSKESTYRGLQVRYSHRQTADDVIEQLLRVEKHPKLLAVVSNDNRIRDAAKRKGCQVYSTDAFVDWLMAPAMKPSAPPPPPDVESPTDAEMASWLKVFSKPK